MSACQPDLFHGDRRPPRQYADHRYRRAEKPRARPYAWVSMAAWVRHMGRLFAVETASGDHYERVRASARELTPDRVRECRHDDDLARAERLLADARHGRSPWLFGLELALAKAELGTLLMEVRNRRRLLALGRDRARVRGPRLNPARMPLDAIERLIQHHSDLELVKRLRAERARRLDVRPGLDDTARGHRP